MSSDMDAVYCQAGAGSDPQTLADLGAQSLQSRDCALIIRSRYGAGLAEITRVLTARALLGYPQGIRVIVRRERPHPGAQLDAFEEADGWRYTAFATDTRVGQLARLDARHRAHARVEDRIRCAKDTGLDHFPSRSFAINQAWLSVVMLAVDLIA